MPGGFSADDIDSLATLLHLLETLGIIKSKDGRYVFVGCKTGYTNLAKPRITIVPSAVSHRIKSSTLKKKGH